MSYLTGSGKPSNIIKVQRFVAEVDNPVYFSLDEVVFLMPIFRWDETDQHFVDATGDYDLCMSEDGLKYKFINRRDETITFAYRFIPAYWLAKRLNA